MTGTVAKAAGATATATAQTSGIAMNKAPPCEASSSSTASKVTLPASTVIKRISKLLNAQSLAGLLTKNYVVIDDAFPLAYAQAYREEIIQLQKTGLLTNNHTAYVSAVAASASQEQSSIAPKITHLFAKPHIFETELFHDTLDSIPYLGQLYTHILPFLDELLAGLLPSLNLYHGDSTIKVQYNSGNGAFPFHFDSPGGRDTRRVTALLYLNPFWEENHGGHLRLQPFLANSVRIAPLMNRLVLFRSDVLLHRVEPSISQERICLTLWCHGRSLDKEIASQGSEKFQEECKDEIESHANEFASHWESLLQNIRFQRMLSKAIYMQEWHDSISQAHETEGETMLQESLENDVQSIFDNGGPTTRSVIDYLRQSVQENFKIPLTINSRIITSFTSDLTDDENTSNSEEREIVFKDVTSDTLDFLDFL